MSTNIIKTVKKAFNEYIETVHNGNVKQASIALGVASSTLYKWTLWSNPEKIKEGTKADPRAPQLEHIAPLLEEWGYSLVYQDKQPLDSASDLEKENMHLKAQNELLNKLLKKYEKEEAEREERASFRVSNLGFASMQNIASLENEND